MPTPDGPVRAVNSPSAISNEISFNILRLRSGVTKVLLRSFTVINGSIEILILSLRTWIVFRDSILELIVSLIDFFASLSYVVNKVTKL